LIESETGWLNDNVINGILYKLKQEFPLLFGLQDTMLSGHFILDPVTGLKKTLELFLMRSI
jgi:hypothetical protein